MNCNDIDRTTTTEEHGLDAGGGRPSTREDKLVPITDVVTDLLSGVADPLKVVLSLPRGDREERQVSVG